jgi:ATP-dependent Clp protease ATP-binding subunit ClpA
MAESAAAFARLVAQVHQHAATADPAGLLDAAAAISAEHAADADRLLDHFVHHARGSGMSWTDIGARLGVSKQAARQRFAASTAPAASTAMPFAAQPTPHLQACLHAAAGHARADGAAVGTEHLLAGLLTEGTAAAILERLGVRIDAVRAATHRLFGVPSGAPDADPPSRSAAATCALDAAAHHAAAETPKDETPRVRPEHLLAALALDPGSRARRILNHLGVDVAALRRDLQQHIAISTTRPARWWKRRPAPPPGCSFCGRTASAAGRLVNGPGVTICRSCVDLAHQILQTHEPAR